MPPPAKGAKPFRARQEPHPYYSIRERKLQGRMHFLPYEISKPFRTHKSLYFRQKRLSAVLKTEPFRADLRATVRPRRPLGAFCPPAQSEKQAAAVLRWVLRKGCAKTEAPAGAALQQKAAFIRLLSAAASPCSLANAHRNYEKAPPRLVFSNGSTQ